jgi:hypothetical protein
MVMAEVKEGTFRLDAAASPRAIDLRIIDGGTGTGIYSLEGDKLKLCLELCLSGKEKQNRPSEFSGKDDSSNQAYFVLKRETPAAKGQKDAEAKDPGKKASEEREFKDRVIRQQNAVIDWLKKEREGIAGTLAKIDIEKNTVSITLRNTKIVVDAVQLSSGAKVYMNGKKCSIDDLKVGMQVILEVETVDGKTRITGVRGIE